MAYSDSTKMPFGKYEGIELANVPASYLLWFHGEYQTNPPNSQVGKNLAAYIKDNLDGLNAEAQ